MPTVNIRTVLAASGTASPLQGSQYEYLGAPAFIEIATKTDATGVLRTVQTGSDIVEEESPVAIGTINVQPLYPDDFLLNDVVGAGERISVKLRDTTGAQRIVLTSMRISFL